MRITGGQFRSRALVAPKGDKTRPTSDRVREALFSMLQARGVLQGAVVLDLYAGTGALSLEALSRGAAQVTLVEADREAQRALGRNIEVLGVRAQTTIFNGTVESFAARGANIAPYTIIFADPPYREVNTGSVQAVLDRVLQRLEGARTGASPTAPLVVLEHASRDAAPALTHATRTDTRIYGDTAVSFYEALDEALGGR
jgi:16S rRNA (guanine966-N2)-methyltransferase